MSLCGCGHLDLAHEEGRCLHMGCRDRHCAVCGNCRGAAKVNAKCCTSPECREAYRKRMRVEAVRRARMTEGGKAIQRRYDTSEKGKARRAEHKQRQRKDAAARKRESERKRAKYPKLGTPEYDELLAKRRAYYDRIAAEKGVQPKPSRLRRRAA